MSRYLFHSFNFLRQASCHSVSHGATQKIESGSSCFTLHPRNHRQWFEAKGVCSRMGGMLASLDATALDKLKVTL